MNKKHANNHIENTAITSLLSGSWETVENPTQQGIELGYLRAKNV
ncbi:MAG TPA: hypothetical protein VFY68_12470 [Nitrososphaeraceae archaeon]|nr:hypothetical protein [Nitrososphaeraceae archaeon]